MENNIFYGSEESSAIHSEAKSASSSNFSNPNPTFSTMNNDNIGSSQPQQPHHHTDDLYSHEVRKLGAITRFLAWCGGSDLSILSRCPESVVNFHLSTGLVVCIAALFASLSMSYALHHIFSASLNNYQIGALALLWGFFIFTLDRYIVSGVDKNVPFVQQLKSAAPRIAIAIILSLIISKPIELYIFGSRIDAQVQQNEMNSKQTQRTQVDNIYSLDKKQNDLRQEEANLNNLQAEAQGEPNSTEYLSKKREYENCRKEFDNLKVQNKGAIERKEGELKTIRNNPENYTMSESGKTMFVNDGLRARANALKADIAALKNELGVKEKACGTLQNEMNEMKHTYQTQQKEAAERHQIVLQGKQKEYEMARAQHDSTTVKVESINERAFGYNLVTRIEAMHDLTKENRTMLFISLALWILFLIIELAPILVKLMTATSYYDRLKAHRDREMDSDLESKSHQHNIDRSYNLIRYESTEVQRLRIHEAAVQMQAFKKYAEQMEQAQSHLLQLVERWMEQMMRTKDPKKQELLLQKLDSLIESYFKNFDQAKTAFDSDYPKFR
ncbi:MAG: DUF4407 domain-containing protein [Sphingobacteriales bacterium]|nr:DUF4407 domain-containing protein [Sphingobacteriales bacterium]